MCGEAGGQLVWRILRYIRKVSTPNFYVDDANIHSGNGPCHVCMRTDGVHACTYVCIVCISHTPPTVLVLQGLRLHGVTLPIRPSSRRGAPTVRDGATSSTICNNTEYSTHVILRPFGQTQIAFPTMLGQPRRLEGDEPCERPCAHDTRCTYLQYRCRVWSVQCCVWRLLLLAAIVDFPYRRAGNLCEGVKSALCVREIDRDRQRQRGTERERERERDI